MDNNNLKTTHDASHSDKLPCNWLFHLYSYGQLICNSLNTAAARCVHQEFIPHLHLTNHHLGLRLKCKPTSILMHSFTFLYSTPPDILIHLHTNGFPHLCSHWLRQYSKPLYLKFPVERAKKTLSVLEQNQWDAEHKSNTDIPSCHIGCTLKYMQCCNVRSVDSSVF